jgi:hypothetical protein
VVIYHLFDFLAAITSIARDELLSFAIAPDILPKLALATKNLVAFAT